MVSLSGGGGGKGILLVRYRQYFVKAKYAVKMHFIGVENSFTTKDFKVNYCRMSLTHLSS